MQLSTTPTRTTESSIGPKVDPLPLPPQQSSSPPDVPTPTTLLPQPTAVVANTKPTPLTDRLPAIPLIQTPPRNMAATRPPPPYCEVVYMNGNTFVRTVSDDITSTYEKAAPLTTEQSKVYRTPAEGMILMQITNTAKVVTAFVANTVQAKLITTTTGEKKKRTDGPTGLTTTHQLGLKPMPPCPVVPLPGTQVATSG